MEPSVALQYPGEWKFEGVGYEIPRDAISDFVDLLVDIAEKSKAAVERFKTAFGDSALSTGLDWAITDLRRAMDSRSSNAAAFLDTLWSCIEDGNARGLKVPPHRTVNRILEKYQVPLRIEPPDVVNSDQWTPSIYEVGFRRGGFCFSNGQTHVECVNDAKCLEQFEVIGNICQNP
jgi:hypothetical protein